MIDIIGKRRYGYILSATLMVIGLVFILATLIPNGNVGLQFSIAYTGGTVWEVHFEDGTPEPNDVRAVLEEVGLDGEVAITEANDQEFVLIRTEALSLQEPELAEGSAAALAAEATAEPPTEATESAALESPGASEAPAQPGQLAASSEPTESAAPDATTAPQASPGADVAIVPAEDGAGGGTSAAVPTEGRFGELAAALQAEFGPIDEVRQENSVGPIVSQELIYQTFLLVLIAAGAIMVWVAYRFRDFRMGATALVALLHDVIIVVGSFAVLGTFIGLQIDSLFVTAMLDRHRLLRARHHRGLRPHP